MAITYTDFNDGDTLGSIRTKLNSFNNSVVAETSILQNSISSNTTDIVSNSTNIASNTANINANYFDITDNQDRIADLESLTLYEFNKVSGISTTSAAYTEANRLTVTTPPSGVYEYSFSFTFNYGTTNKSAYFRFSTDGGTTWNEIRKEAKDVTDNIPLYYSFPVNFVQTGTDNIVLIVEYRVETAGDVLNVSYMDVIVERKA